jgi:hypothetical protein
MSAKFIYITIYIYIIYNEQEAAPQPDAVLSQTSQRLSVGEKAN